jgi:hypothetical protein
MSWIYILVLCLAIYYIVARYLEKYVENFDPSLVPVSSIVTLAKVAQKLVDGGGTLTNPGNLTIGTPENKGNLIVTGTTNLVGNTTIGATTVGVTGAAATTTNLTVNGAERIIGNSTIDGKLNVNAGTTVAGTIATIGNINFTQNFQNTPNGTQSEISNDIVSKALLIVGNAAGTVPTGGVGGHNRNVHLYDNLTIADPIYQGSLTVNGNTNLTGTLTVSDSVSFANGKWNTSSGSNRLFFDTVNTIFGSPGKWYFQTQAGTNVANIDSNGSMSIEGDLEVKGNFTGNAVFKGKLNSEFNQSMSFDSKSPTSTYTFPKPITTRGTYIMSISNGYSNTCWLGFYVNTYQDGGTHKGEVYGLTNSTGGMITSITSNNEGKVTIGGGLTGNTIYMKLTPSF